MKIICVIKRSSVELITYCSVLFEEEKRKCGELDDNRSDADIDALIKDITWTGPDQSFHPPI